MSNTTSLSNRLPETRVLKQKYIRDYAEDAVREYKNTKRTIKRKVKRLPGVKLVVGSRAAQKAIRGGGKYLGPIGTALAIGDTQLIRSITKLDAEAFVDSFVDGIRYFPEAAAFICENPAEAANEILYEGLLVGAGESAIMIYENIDPTGYVYDHKRNQMAWIADSQGGHKVTYTDNDGNPKTTFEKQEYLYSFVPSKKEPMTGQLIVYRPAEGLTEERDRNNNKKRELLRVPVAQFDIKNGRVTQEFERSEDGTVTIHTYDDSNPTYQWLNQGSNYTDHLTEKVETNEIFARYGIPETKYGALVGQETATDILNKIKIGKRVSSKINNKGKSFTIVDWEKSQGDTLEFTSLYERITSENFYIPNSKDMNVRETTLQGIESFSITYKQLAELGIDISGDKTDPKVRERIVKDMSAKTEEVEAKAKSIIPYEETENTKYQYVSQTSHIEPTTGHASFFKEHPLFGQRNSVYTDRVIDYDSNTIKQYDKKGNLITTITYDNPSEENNYQYTPNNVFIPTDEDGIEMQFAPTGEFLGFYSEKQSINKDKITKLELLEEFVGNYNTLKEGLGVTSLAEMRKKLSTDEYQNGNEWISYIDEALNQMNSSYNEMSAEEKTKHEKEIETQLATSDSKQIGKLLSKYYEQDKQFEKQFSELEKKLFKPDKNGNISFSTKYHPQIKGKEITETDENGDTHKVVKLDSIPNFFQTDNPEKIPNMVDVTFAPKNHKDFPPTAASKNEFFTKIKQDGGFDYYRINYNGTPETQNYGGYVQEDPLTKVCQVFDQNGKCVYIDVPTADAKDDANWASNPNSDKYQRIHGMVVESERGGIYSDEDILEIAEKQQKTSIPFEYGFKLAEYEKVLKKPFEDPNHKGYYDRYDVLHAGSYERTQGATTNAYITEQEKYLSELEDILNKQPQQTPTIQAEKKALAKQREILTRMRQKPENDRIAEAREQAILFDTQVKRTSVPLPKHVAKININDYISNKDDDLTQPISLCHQQKNPDKTVYRFNAMNQQCTGIMIEDKKTGVCKIYDNNGCLMDIDKPLNNSEEEQINPYDNTRSLRYRDIVKKVNTRVALYNYISNPEHPCPELCANEERDTYQSRLANHAHQQQQDDFSIDLDMPVISAAKTETNLDFNPLNDISTTEISTPPSDLLAQNDDGSYKNNLMNQPTNKPNSNKDNQAVATNEEESQPEDKDTAKNPKETDPKKAVASTAKSGLKSSLRNAQENNSIQIDAERVEEQINNPNQMAVASQSR